MYKFLTIALFVLLSVYSRAQSLKFIVHPDSTMKEPLSGRLYIFTQPDTTRDVGEPDPFTPSPVFYIDVKNWQPGQLQIIDSTAAAWTKLSQVKEGFYKFGALFDINTQERPLQAPGNYFNRRDAVVEVNRKINSEIHLYLNGIFKERVFKESDSVKEVKLRSKLLSAFHKKDIFMKTAVVLPAGYSENSTKEYSLVCVIPGWGGTHYDATQPYPAQRYGFRMGKDKIYLYLNPDTHDPFGLHAFVDSRVNGPWGKALVEELIPYITKNYRVKKDPSQHFLVGQSTGGYGVLWLQLNYPKAFGGCWAVSPDPVDFSDFTSVDIYEPNANMYYNTKDAERPFFIWEGKPVSTLKAFIQFETFMGDGGQIQAFEAEFGKPGKDGRPLLLFDRQTGAINAEVAESFKPYDMGLYIQQNWKKIGKDLRGKVHIYAGADDNFFLDRAVLRLKEKAQSVNADVVAELIPDANHFSIWSPAFTKRVQAEIDQLVKE